MCTALKYGDCMGRNYDYEQSFKETLIDIPRHQHGNEYEVIGICTGMVKEYPLLYDGMNDEGLCCGALAFTGNAQYNKYIDGKYNTPPYDMVFNILGMFKDVGEVKEHYANVNIVDGQYNPEFPNSDLHWFVCDKDDSLVIEQTNKGLKLYTDNQDILTNNPPYPQQVMNCIKQNSLVGTYDEPTDEYVTRGTETYGLLGDTTSMSRFSRGHYYMEMMKGHKDNPASDMVSTFHLLSNLEQCYGATPVEDKYEYTIYSVVYDMEQLDMNVRAYDSMEVKRFGFDGSDRRTPL